MKTTVQFGFLCSCGSSDSRVLRTSRSTGRVLRRRQCLACGQRITTVERPVCSARANTPATGVGQLADSLSLLSGRTVRLPLSPKN